MIHKYMEKCLPSVVIREMKIKATQIHLIPVRLAIIKETNNNNAGKAADERELLYNARLNVKQCSYEWKSVWRLLRKLKRDLPYYSCDLTRRTSSYHVTVIPAQQCLLQHCSKPLRYHPRYLYMRQYKGFIGKKSDLGQLSFPFIHSNLEYMFLKCFPWALSGL